jgi:type I restriction enzyme S subunit
MSNWETKPIKMLGRVVTGKTPPKENSEYFEGGECLFVSPKDFSWEQFYVTKTQTLVTEKALEKFKNQVIPKNTIMFTSLSFAFGKMGIASRNCLTNQQINSIIVNSKHDYRFVFYLLKAYRPIIFSYNSGIDTPIVPKSVFEGIEVKCPSLVSQKKIAAILSAYDDLIENNKRRIALLENMAEEIYREWFVRFRFPNYKNAEFEKGIPKGWEISRAYSFFGHVKGKSYGGDELSDELEEGMPFINLKSFNRGGGYRADGLKFYSGSYREQQVVKEGDVVMAVTDMTQNREVVGRVARVPDVGDKGAVISLDVIKLTPKSISATFLYAYLKYSGFADFIKAFANGANVLHLQADLVTQQTIVMPPEHLRSKFEKLVDPIHEQIGALSKAITVLERTKNSLLPRLISGKLTVENLNIQFPPSMVEAEIPPNLPL